VVARLSTQSFGVEVAAMTLAWRVDPTPWYLRLADRITVSGKVKG
jgi:hypothetical protein